MPRFFVNEIDEGNIRIEGPDARHIGRSLRMKNGESITVCCNGIDYNCVIESITADDVYLRLVDKQRCAAEPNVEVTLFQAVPKLDKLEHIIQKTVELGVARIVPVLQEDASRDLMKRISQKNCRGSIKLQKKLPNSRAGE